MDEQKINALANKLINGTISEQELHELEAWYNTIENLEQEVNSDIDQATMGKRIFEMIAIKANLKSYPKRKIVLWPRVAAAASIILCLSFGGYYLLRKQPPQQIAQKQLNDIAPGGNKAILTLSNGQKISLTDARNGNIAQQHGTQIRKAQNGQIVYLANSLSANGDNSTEMAYNTISTPRGGQWRLSLPDGSRVWLNAASSITFPTTFTGTNRTVKITGEAYFEIAHNATKPFIVTTKSQTIQDIGTHFNINAYDDESSIRTTLVEGSIKVSNITGSAILIPGQQSIVQNENKIVVKRADIDEAIAWKSGRFHFDHSDIPTIMREFSRWYNVDIEYKGNVPSGSFTGNIDRNSNASVALQILSIAGVHFQIQDKKIIVQP